MEQDDLNALLGIEPREKDYRRSQVPMCECGMLPAPCECVENQGHEKGDSQNCLRSLFYETPQVPA